MIIVKEVTSKKELKEFINFPNQLYKNNQYYCPLMQNDELDNFNQKKNKAYQFCESKLFLAYEGKKIVGRIAAIYNQKHVEKFMKRQLRFTRFDVIDDINVSKALFQAICQFAETKGLDEIVGPLGFCNLDKSGMLIAGFNEYNLSFTTYNYEYYQKHMEILGFKKDADWIEHQLFVPKSLDQRQLKIANYISQKYQYKVISIDNNIDIRKYASDALKLINEAFKPLYAVIPLTNEMINDFINKYIRMLNKNNTILVCDKNDQVIGFGLMLPSLAKANKDSRGKLWPFGWWHYLKALKSKNNKILEMYIMGVKPSYQNTGVNALIMIEAVKICHQRGFEYGETGPELELNEKVQNQWKSFDARQHRRRRSWVIETAKIIQK